MLETKGKLLGSIHAPPAATQGASARAALESRLIDALGWSGQEHARSSLARLTDGELAATVSRLERLRAECGCAAGAASLVGIALVGTSPALRAGASPALLGKVGGMLLASMQRRIERARVIRQRLEPSDGVSHVIVR